MDFGIRVFCFVLLMVQFIDSLKNVICEKTNKQTKTKTSEQHFQKTYIVRQVWVFTQVSFVDLKGQEYLKEKCFLW